MIQIECESNTGNEKESMFHYPHVVIHLLRFRNCFLRFTHLLIAVQFRNSFLCAKKEKKE